MPHITCRRIATHRGPGAFTLIELLVSIAIISTLAAILLPTLIQSKQKALQTKCMSNMKQIALATMLYCDDYDGVMPLAAPITPDGRRVYTLDHYTVPAGWGDNGHPAGLDIGGTLNILNPYIKSHTMWSCPSGVDRGPNRAYPPVSGDLSRAWGVSYPYNGYLNAYRSEDITSPSNLVVFWEGYGLERNRGYATSRPSLSCQSMGIDAEGCRFKLVKGTEDWQGVSTVWVHTGNVQNSVRADGSAHAIRLGTNPINNDPTYDPCLNYDETGRCTKMSLDSDGYVPYFRPDNRF